MNVIFLGLRSPPGRYEAYLEAVNQSEEAKQDYLREFKQALEVYKADPGPYSTVDEWPESNDPPSLRQREPSWQPADGQESSLLSSTRLRPEC